MRQIDARIETTYSTTVNIQNPNVPISDILIIVGLSNIRISDVRFGPFIRPKPN